MAGSGDRARSAGATQGAPSAGPSMMAAGFFSIPWRIGVSRASRRSSFGEAEGLSLGEGGKKPRAWSWLTGIIKRLRTQVRGGRDGATGAVEGKGGIARVGYEVFEYLFLLGGATLGVAGKERGTGLYAARAREALTRSKGLRNQEMKYYNARIYGDRYFFRP